MYLLIYYEFYKDVVRKAYFNVQSNYSVEQFNAKTNKVLSKT